MKVFLLFLSLFCSFSAFAAQGQSLTETQILAKAEQLHSFNPPLVLAIATVESRLHPTLRETDSAGKHFAAGGWGLMQLRLGTARMLGFRGNAHRLLRWETNLALAVKYLERQAEQYGREHLDSIVAAYNAGAAYVCRTGKIERTGTPCEVGRFVNQNYVNAVLRVYRMQDDG